MGLVVKTYTFLPKITADASEVNLDFDTLYTLVNGNLNSENIAAGMTLNACQITVLDASGNFSESTVEEVLAELKHIISNSATLQAFSEGRIGVLGSGSQQYAGHLWGVQEPGYTACELIALYLFDNGVLALNDENSAYTLQQGPIPPYCGAGIFGSNNAIVFSGGNSSNILYNGTLLDNMSAISALAIDFWFDGSYGIGITSTAAVKYIFSKYNSANDYIGCWMDTAGSINVQTKSTGSTTYTLKSVTQVPSATTGNHWHYVCIAKDTANGLRLFIDSVLEAANLSATEIIGNGTTGEFVLGNLSTNISASHSFNGRLGMFRIRNKVITQRDVDIAYASKYLRPSMPTGAEISIRASLMHNSSSEHINHYDFENKIITINESSIYRAGGVITDLSADDRLQLFLRS